MGYLLNYPVVGRRVRISYACDEPGEKLLTHYPIGNGVRARE
jgi:hypothetical protein